MKNLSFLANPIYKNEKHVIFECHLIIEKKYKYLIRFQHSKYDMIDYPNDKMFLEPQDQLKVRYNLLGLELRKIRSGEFVIRYIFPEFPANKHDLKVGDLITNLDHISAKKLSLSDALNISATPGIKQVCIARGNACFNILAQHIAGYSNHHK